MALQAVNRGESLSDRAYRMLRNAILSGELAPGEPLTEESLAERLQISRTPHPHRAAPAGFRRIG